MNRDDELRETVHEHGGRMTRQRRVILDTLADVHTHPTAAELYDMVREQLPDISQATVYRNLRQLQELGYVRELSYGTDASHYDARVEPHYHVRCRRCGRVDDVHLDVEPTPSVEDARRAADRWRIDGCRVEFVGLCPDCSEAEDAEHAQDG